MKLGLFFTSLCISIVVISYMTYNINEYMGNSLELREINFSNKKCHLINIPTTINHLIPLNDKILIGSEYQSYEYLNFKSILESKGVDEYIYLIHLKNEKYSKARIVDFPKNVPLHPGGLSLYKKSNIEYILYILNHSVNNIYGGKERIEKIILNYNPSSEEVIMIYDSSIILPDEFFFKIDSISVINEDIFYFNTNTPFSSPRDLDELLDIKNFIRYKSYEYLKPFMTMLNIKKCYTYIYDNRKDENKTKIIYNSESLLNKGITYDTKRKVLYVVKSLEKKIYIFKIDETDEYNAKLIKTIPILYVGNNIFYDEGKDLIYVGINGKMNEYDSIVNAYKKNNYIENVETYSGYEIIDPNNNYSISELMIMKNEFKWVSSSIQINEKNYMSSIFSKGLYVCSD